MTKAPSTKVARAERKPEPRNGGRHEKSPWPEGQGLRRGWVLPRQASGPEGLAPQGCPRSGGDPEGSGERLRTWVRCTFKIKYTAESACGTTTYDYASSAKQVARITTASPLRAVPQCGEATAVQCHRCGHAIDAGRDRSGAVPAREVGNDLRCTSPAATRTPADRLLCG